MNFARIFIKVSLVYVKNDWSNLIHNVTSSNLQINTQINIQNAILRKNQCKQIKKLLNQ